MRRHRAATFVLLLLASAGFRPAPGAQPAGMTGDERVTMSARDDVALRHDVHVTSARVAVEPRVVLARIRFFREDLELALRTHVRDARFQLVVNPRADSLLTDYAARHLRMRSAGRALTLSLVGSGEEKGMKPELDIWWVDFRLDASAPLARELEITNDLLFELFRDQTNMMKFRLPSGAEKTVVFVPGEASYRLAL